VKLTTPHEALCAAIPDAAIRSRVLKALAIAYTKLAKVAPSAVGCQPAEAQGAAASQHWRTRCSLWPTTTPFHRRAAAT